MKQVLVALITIISLKQYAQNSNIPDWFLEDIQNMKGTWVADNTLYMSEQEPYKAYESKWVEGIDSKSLSGKLYGINKSGDKILFWEFRQYWDNELQKAVIIQFGNNNVIGKGEMYPKNKELMESVQTFSLNDGSKWTEKHHSIVKKDTLTTTSFELQQNNTWKKKRKYNWIKQKSLDLKQFSMSLAVKDLEKSKSFYENLGFSVVDGKMEQNWLILKNDEIKIGLFKGMFPTNTITFNPNNARLFYNILKNKGVKILYENGMDKKKGACSFSFVDPDGNPILIDQH